MAYDRTIKDQTTFDYSDFKTNYEFFLPLTGKYEKAVAYSEHPADTKACEKMGRLYDHIQTINHYEDPAEKHTLNVFLTRLLFCFFAEDTGIFPEQNQIAKALMRPGETLQLGDIILDDTEHPVYARVQKILSSGGIDQVLTTLLNTSTSSPRKRRPPHWHSSKLRESSSRSAIQHRKSTNASRTPAKTPPTLKLRSTFWQTSSASISIRRNSRTSSTPSCINSDSA